ncbi:MAG: T9SS type A sorting domain-containing protein, partial [Ignavibacteria bacterium]|nr:T9SS type A sorting domain-containing protein [Ignavibacteria bacterium]
TSGTTTTLHGVSFTDANNGTVVGDGGTILRTTNGGANWTSQISGTTRELWGVSFTDINTGTVVGGLGEILRTINGGTNWTLQSSGTTNLLQGVCFTDLNNGTAIGSFGEILRTTNGGGTFVNQTSSEIPERFSLYQNYPNPFNPTTTIQIKIPVYDFIELTVYNISGKEVAELVEQKLKAGVYKITFDASGLSSGVYFYTMRSSEFSQVRKMIYLK